MIAPSLATGDLLNLEEEVRALEQAGAKSLHFDIMDGHFVPLLTIGVPVLEQMRKITSLNLDVHIMITNPDETFERYLDAGADTLTFHFEAARHAHRIVAAIQERNKKAGISINPGTPWQSLKALLPLVDQVTVMGVNPGFSRQKHIPHTKQTIQEINNFCGEKGLHDLVIQVDGGVSDQNIAALYAAGATNFVAGGYVFGNPDAKLQFSDKIAKYSQAIQNLLHTIKRREDE